MSDKQPLVQPTPPGQGYGPPPPPAQQGGYGSQPPPAYNQAGGPPPAYPPPATTSNTVIFAQQPRTPVVYSQPRGGSGDNFLMLSIILSFVCFFCGSWWALVCTIPAIFMALNAQEAESRGDLATMERSRRSALYLNITGLVVGVALWIVFILAVSVSLASGG